MTFVEAVRVCLKDKYCCFRGRASRSEFWWFSLCIGLINLGANLLLSPLPRGTAMGLNFVISLALLLPNLGVTVRRLHDRNLAGWWLLIPIVSLLLWLLGRGAPGGEAGPASALLSLSMCICYLAILSMPGTAGSNRFGPDPLAAEQARD
ncbi:DUF805 domain-containing protein [Desulfovibrio porci]|uniref:DUF805 domain-containing protein n=1 Tax=Desulfovibrio porci TaxID=2605782 RepID=UPI002A7FABE6|nr:DUF805 domain-containing protein [Desulfovibrio porci]MDY3809261.1 DUF805 domain-containing protein [Desulfovibrio porci]